MNGVETCPDCGERLWSDSPAGLCPSCLLRLGAAFSIDPKVSRSREAGDAAFGAATAAVRLRESSDDTPLTLTASDDFYGNPDPSKRYQLLGELARGGMGAIFKGRDLYLGRDLAVKVIREEHGDHPEMVRRFVEEARIGGRLQHPGIVPVHELGRLPDGRMFIAMKLVRGRTLAALLAARRGPDDERTRFLAIFEQVCQTVAYAHSKGVIHRDLKPSNVMVGSFGEVQVMDWGLAKVLDQGGLVDEDRPAPTCDDALEIRSWRDGSEPMESRPGSVLGTPSYMAPEQACGAMDTLDERADVFALGSILCEILTGGPAFEGETSSEIYRKAEKADLSDALGRLDACSIDSELVELARSCLAVAPKHRPRDASVVVSRLTAYLRGVEGRLRDAELATARAEARAAGERRRRQLTLALVASMLVTGLIGAAGWGWAGRERRRRLGAVDDAVNAALADSARKREKAIAAGSDPILWVEAIEAARRAETLLTGNDATAERRERVRRFLDELTRERDAIEAVEKDRHIGERLAAVLNDFGVHGDERKANADYAAAFRFYGVDVDSLEPSAAGRLLATSPVAPELASALDQWAILRRSRVLRDPAGADRLIEVARRADPDPWRNRLRDTVGRSGGGSARRLEVLERLAATADVEHLPVTSVTRLATSLAIFGGRDTAIALLRRAQSSHRDDFWVNADLGRELLAASRPEEAERFYAIASGVRPQSPLALGGLGRAILMSGQPEEAADLFRQWIRLRPEDPLSHVALGAALLAIGQSSEAYAEFAEAKRLKPKDWMVRDQIGLAFSDRGDWDSAIREQSEAVRLFPNSGVAHKALAHALQSAGRLKEAVAEFREAVRLDPRVSASHLFLGRALIEMGEPRAALEALARIGAGPPPDPLITPEMLTLRAEEFIALEPRLADVIEGRDSPVNAREAASFARLAFARNRPEEAARLWSQAFAASPDLAEDLVAMNRFQAARAAARAGTEEGVGRMSESEVESRLKWRRRAIEWLHADLEASKAILDSGTASLRAGVARRLSRWRVDPDLASIRDEPALSTLPEAERSSLRKLWDDVGSACAANTVPATRRSEPDRNF
jgi:tetratricopeptide (TPR) repeat protein/tRNA A-37 threonylcarbamoyl transferase component Bud32